MGWQDRLKPPGYTSPKGTRIDFLYENVSKITEKHTAAFEFADSNGTFVQSLGRSGRRLPLRVIFSGDDYDLFANTFDAMLDEDGIGILDHPVYGTFNVVPFGNVTRRDDVKTRGNQAIFEVTFYETNNFIFPQQVDSAAELLQAAIDAYVEAAPPEFEETLEQDTTIEKVAVRDRYALVKDQVKAGLKAVAAVNDKIESVFDTVSASIDDAIEVFIADPLALAFQTSILVQAPARSTALITARLAAYGSLLTTLTTNIYVPGLNFEPNNSFRSDDMLASNLLIGEATAVLHNEFETKTDALAAADTLLAALDEFTVWRDDNLSSLGVIDTGAVYQQVINAILTAAGFLVEISFTLKQERSIVLVTPMTLTELEARHYRTVDENLDFLIQSNAIVGEEFFLVPIGRTVVYYT